MVKLGTKELGFITHSTCWDIMKTEYVDVLSNTYASKF